MTSDYKKTVFLPRTGFPMKGNLPVREPAMLERWEKMDLYRRQREQSKGREKFILHDGPPYANGHLHIGHALNKILKDVVTRSQQMLGKDSNYVPGWDCHGLPIEWQVEQKYRKAGKDKDTVPVAQFRKECREFATQWIDVQRDGFKRLGVSRSSNAVCDGPVAVVIETALGVAGVTAVFIALRVSLCKVLVGADAYAGGVSGHGDRFLAFFAD